MHLVSKLFGQLEGNPSRLDKVYLIDKFKKDNSELIRDLEFCLEVLAGQHKIGFTLNIDDSKNVAAKDYHMTIEIYCYNTLFCMPDHTESSIEHMQYLCCSFGWFLNPLFNREWKLGIGPSQLQKPDVSPMLAKKFDPEKFPQDDSYYLTEKIDGNRCIAKYSIEKAEWTFWSRSGKQLKVKFDMADLPTEYIFDGEVVSEDQYENPSQGNFNATSGIINSKYGSKTGLIYLIFDIICKIPYKDRRPLISGFLGQKMGNYISKNVHILPVLEICNKDDLVDKVSKWLDLITSNGGEGVMINLGSAIYENKRTDKLLKVKKVYTMDMKVIATIPGTGKYEGLVGSLECYVSDPEKKIKYYCMVGSGLSDYQRARWAYHPEEIVGKIVEVAYFSLSQDRLLTGTTQYSLRFPRLKRVRDDKDDTSVD